MANQFLQDEPQQVPAGPPPAANFSDDAFKAALAAKGLGGRPPPVNEVEQQDSAIKALQGGATPMAMPPPGAMAAPSAPMPPPHQGMPIAGTGEPSAPAAPAGPFDKAQKMSDELLARQTASKGGGISKAAVEARNALSESKTKESELAQQQMQLATKESEARLGVMQSQQKATDLYDAETQKQNDYKQAHTAQQTQKLEALTSDAQNSSVDPSRFWKNPGSVLMAIGAALGGGAAARVTGRNEGMVALNGAIDRDLAAQAKEIETKKGKVDLQNNLLARTREMFGTEQEARAAARRTMLEQANAQFAQVAEKSKSPELQRQAQVLAQQNQTRIKAEDMQLRQASDQAAASAYARDTAAREHAYHRQMQLDQGKAQMALAEGKQVAQQQEKVAEAQAAEQEQSKTTQKGLDTLEKLKALREESPIMSRLWGQDAQRARELQFELGLDMAKSEGITGRGMHTVGKEYSSQMGDPNGLLWNRPHYEQAESRLRSTRALHASGGVKKAEKDLDFEGGGAE